MLPSDLRPVEAPDHYWEQVANSAFAKARLAFVHYESVEHPYIEDWWSHHWELAERLLDELAYSHIRFNVFDAEGLAYRYVVTAIEDTSGIIVLTEFRLLD